MTNSFRIDASELAGWHAGLAARVDVRGVAAIAKEVEAHLGRKEPDDTVIVSRHQLFTWAEALCGAATRDSRPSAPGAPGIAQTANEMRAILSGRQQGAAPPAPARSAPPAPAPRGISAYVPPPPVSYQAPAPVQYGAAPAALAGSARFVSGVELAASIRELIRGARSEVCVSSPWDSGLESLVPDLVALAPDVRLHVVSRRPMNESPAYHQAMDQMGRRRAVTAFSGHIQTRFIVVDGERALVGAASIPGPTSREAGLVVNDRGAAQAVRAHFERVWAEAGGAPRA